MDFQDLKKLTIFQHLNNFIQLKEFVYLKYFNDNEVFRGACLSSTDLFSHFVFCHLSVCLSHFSRTCTLFNSLKSFKFLQVLPSPFKSFQVFYIPLSPFESFLVSPSTFKSFQALAHNLKSVLNETDE